MKMTEKKQILLLGGSKNDFLDKDQNYKKEVFNVIDKAIKGRPIEVFDRVASADRAHELIRPTLNERKYDGVIAIGALSFVLPAFVQAALKDLRRDKSQRSNKYVSHYFKDETFIPIISVPLNTTAYQTITEQPGGVYPRPGVAVGDVNQAIRCMDTILFNEFDEVQVLGTRGTEKEQEDIVKLLNELGMHKDYVLSNPLDRREYGSNVLDVMVFEQNPQWKCADDGTTLMIGVPKKRKDPNFGSLSKQDHVNTLYVGVGRYNNAAILAAQIMTLSQNLDEDATEKIEKGIKTYIKNQRDRSMEYTPRRK